MTVPPLEQRFVPQQLAARSLYAYKFYDKLSADQHSSTLIQAIRDGATALDLLERWRDPDQVMWRESLRGPLVEAIRIIDGDGSAQQAADHFDLAIRRNPAFNPYLDQVPGGTNAAPIFVAVLTDFERFIREQASTYNPEDFSAWRTALESTPWDKLERCIASAPTNHRSAMRFEATRLMLEEAERREVGPTDFTQLTWDEYRLCSAEAKLTRPDKHAQGRAAMTELAASGNCAPQVRQRAGSVIDALDTMDTLEGYLWTQQWLTFFEDQYTHKPNDLRTALEQQLVQSADDPIIQNYLNDTANPIMVREHHLFNIAISYRNTGNTTKAIAYFDRMIEMSDDEMSTDDLFRTMAELHRLSLMFHVAGDEETIAGKNEILRLIVDYALERLTTAQTVDSFRHNMAYWGRNAAEALGDVDALAIFDEVLSKPPTATPY